MKPNRKLNLLGVILMSATIALNTGCDKDDNATEPIDAVTLNMLNETNGKTMLGDLFINKSNNFRTSVSWLADVGKTSGVGASIEPKTNNLVSEAAVIPGHLYQVFNEAMRRFPSGTTAVQLGAEYYKIYVKSLIETEDELTGAVVKYAKVKSTAKGLSALNTSIGTMREMGDEVAVALPKGGEYQLETNFNEDDDAFRLTETKGKLVIKLNRFPSDTHGPYGDYSVYIRAGGVYTVVKFGVYYYDYD